MNRSPQAQALALLRVRGTPRAIGRQHGEACRESLRAWRDDQMFRLGRIAPRPASRAQLHEAALRHHEHIRANLPDLAEEIRGVAEGAALPHEDILVCQLRRELAGYTRFPGRGDCSLAAARGARPFLAQTVDLAGHMAEFAQVMHVEPIHGPPMLLFTFTGMLAYLGINAHGLAVGINLVLGGSWQPGIPAYLLVRRLLACASVDEALAVAGATGHASSRALTLMDARALATIEYTPHDHRVLRGDRELTHTNHFLHPDMVAAEAINVFALSGSRRRLQALDRRLASVDHSATGEAVIQALFAHSPEASDGLCVHDTADARVESTAAAVCLRPAEGRLTACRGTPCTASFQEFSF